MRLSPLQCTCRRRPFSAMHWTTYMQVGSLALGPGGATCCHGLAPPGGKLSHILWHTSRVTQPHSTQYYYTAHSTFPRPNAEPSVKDADQLAKSLFIRRRIPAKNYAAYICSDFETTLPFTTPEYVTVVLCSSNHGLPLSKYTKTSHHQFYFSLVAYYKNIWIKMAIYCPEGSGTLRQQLLMMH